MRKNIIIDTDPGQDDAVAIMMALGSPELEVLGITVVAGNVPLNLTARNTRIICELAGRTDIKIFAGADKPIRGDQVTAEHAHGSSGLDGIELFEPSIPLQAMHAIDFLLQTVSEQPTKTVSLCPIGPLTNIALALKRKPEIGQRIEQIVMMGGGYFIQGNVTPSAEFNIFADPEAAEIVFQSGIPITMLPLDVTHKVLANKKRLNCIKSINNSASDALARMLSFYGRYNSKKYGEDGAPLHDPTAIAWLIEPDLFTGKFCNVEIEVNSSLTRGATVIDWWGVTGRKENATVINDVDANGFFELLFERLENLG